MLVLPSFIEMTRTVVILSLAEQWLGLEQKSGVKLIINA